MLKKRIIIISIVVILMISAYIGFSLALFQKPVAQQGSNVISTTDCLSIAIDPVSPVLNITNGYPMEDRIALSKNAYTFDITNDCSHYMEIEIGFEKASTSTLGSDQFKVALNEHGKIKTNYDIFENYPLGTAASGGEARALLHTTLDDNENFSKTFDFRMWIDYDQEAANISGKELTGNIVITATIKNDTALACVDEDHPTPAQGDTFTYGEFKYVYKQKFSSSTGNNPLNYSETWENITDNGWGVHFPKVTALDAEVDLSNLCTTINGLPVVNMENMFYESTHTLLRLPNDFNTKNVNTMAFAFASSRATALNLSGFNTSKVTNMDNMFAGSSAASLDLSNFDTSNVTNMAGMFKLSAAQTVNLRNFDTSKVTTMYQMFYLSGATSLDLSSFDTSNVTDMRQMLSGTTLSSLDVSSFDTSKVTNMARMFYNTKISVLDLSSFDMSSVTTTTGMFQSCTATTGYARTQADADKLNASSNKPATLTFVVKP